MPPLDQHSASKIIKLLLIGDPGSGKTGAIASLVAAGYKVRVIDFDELLAPLLKYVRRTCPDKIKNVSYATFTDHYTPDHTGNLVIQGIPNAFARAVKCMQHWNVDGEDLGKPESWGDDTILVIDSLSSMSQAAFNWAAALNPSVKDYLVKYGVAQERIKNLLLTLRASDYNTNVIVIAHVKYDKNHLGITKGFPKTVGNALDSEVGSWFGHILQAETPTGSPRIIRTKPNGLIELKNSAILPDTLPLETGLATFFKTVRET